MIRLKLLITVLVIGVLLGLNIVYAQGMPRDPFESLLPPEPAPTDDPVVGPGGGLPVGSPRPPVREIPLPKMTIQGVLWGTEMPQVLIDGEVYKVGDDVRGAKIYDIKKNKVTIVFQGRPHELGVTKAGGS